MAMTRTPPKGPAGRSETEDQGSRPDKIKDERNKQEFEDKCKEGVARFEVIKEELRKEAKHLAFKIHSPVKTSYDQRMDQMWEEVWSLRSRAQRLENGHQEP